MRKMHDPAGPSLGSWDPASGGDLITLTVRVAGAAVLLSQRRHRSAIAGLRLGKVEFKLTSLAIIQAIYGIMGPNGSRARVNLDPFGVLTALQPGPRFQQTGDGPGDGGASPIPGGQIAEDEGPVPVPGQIGDGVHNGDGDGDRGVRALISGYGHGAPRHPQLVLCSAIAQLRTVRSAGSQVPFAWVSWS
jgi:hypothetical protein